MEAETIVHMVTFIVDHFTQLLGALNVIVGFLMGLFMFIPGSQPEATLKSVAAFLEKYSKK